MATRICKFSYDDIICDPEGVAEALDKAAHRSIPKHYSGFALLEKGILFLFEEGEDPAGSDSSFVISELGRDSDYESIVATINQRNSSNFTTLAIFPIRGEYWALFRKNS